MSRAPAREDPVPVKSRVDGLYCAQIARRVNISDAVVQKRIVKALAGCQRELKVND